MPLQYEDIPPGGSSAEYTALRGGRWMTFRLPAFRNLLVGDDPLIAMGTGTRRSQIRYRGDGPRKSKSNTVGRRWTLLVPEREQSFMELAYLGCAVAQLLNTLATSCAHGSAQFRIIHEFLQRSC